MILRTCFCAIALSISAIATAQNSATPPEAMAQPMPEVPQNRFGLAMEGWVTLEYSVDANGQVQNIEVIDAIPENLPTEPAEDALEEWPFTPATVDGASIDWHGNQNIVVYDSPDIPFEITPRFIGRYTEVQSLIDIGEYEDALKENVRLREMMLGSLRDAGLAYTQAAVINIRLNDFHAAYEAIQRSTNEQVVTLTDSELVAALSYRFLIEANLGRLVDALHTAERLSALTTDVSAAISQQVAAIETAMTPESALVIKGRIERTPWRHIPSRRVFSIADIDGSVREIVAVCDRRRVTLEYQPDVDWTLPASWGHCTLAVNGRRNTSFVLYEFSE